MIMIDPIVIIIIDAIIISILIIITLMIIIVKNNNQNNIQTKSKKIEDIHLLEPSKKKAKIYHSIKRRFIAHLKVVLIEDTEISKIIFTLVDAGETTLVGEASITKKENWSKNEIPYQ